MGPATLRAFRINPAGRRGIRAASVALLTGLLPLALLAVAPACNGEGGVDPILRREADVTGRKVSLRIDPVSDAAEISFLSRGQRVVVVGRTKERFKIGRFNDYWFRVRLDNGIEGWVYGPQLSVGEGGGAVDDAVDRARIQQSLVGKWYGVRRDGSTGFRRLFLWADGAYKYSFGKTDDDSMQEGKYTLSEDGERITFEPETGFGTELELITLGAELRLTTISDERRIYFKRAFLDPDAPDPGDEDEALQKKMQEDPLGLNPDKPDQAQDSDGE